LKSLGVEPQVQHSFESYAEEIAEPTADLLKNVFLNPAVLQYLSQLASPRLVLEYDYARKGPRLTLRAGLPQESLVLVTGIDAAKSPTGVYAALILPVRVNLFPEPCIDLEFLYRDRLKYEYPTGIEPEFYKGNKRFVVLCLDSGDLEWYLRKLRLLKEVWPLVKTIRELLRLWAEKRGLVFRGYGVEHWRLRDMARFPNAGMIAYLVQILPVNF